MESCDFVPFLGLMRHSPVEITKRLLSALDEDSNVRILRPYVPSKTKKSPISTHVATCRRRCTLPGGRVGEAPSKSRLVRFFDDESTQVYHQSLQKNFAVKMKCLSAVFTRFSRKSLDREMWTAQPFRLLLPPTMAAAWLRACADGQQAL